MQRGMEGMSGLLSEMFYLRNPEYKNLQGEQVYRRKEMIELNGMVLTLINSRRLTALSKRTPFSTLIEKEKNPCL